MKKNFNENIVVAPAGFDETIGSVDYVCTGENDQVTIQAAIDRCIAENKNIYLLNGIYNIDGFYDIGDGGPMTALHFPRCHREIVFKGQNHEYGFQVKFNNGVVLYVTEKALETIVDKETDVIRGDWTDRGCQNGSSLNFENITIILNDNQHAIRCIDFRKTDRVEAKNISLISYGGLISAESKIGLEIAPPVPMRGCIGLSMTDGSNYNYSNYINVQAWGFDEGIQVSGEHVVCINCGASVGRYGFTFGNYITRCGTNHPITLINCLDERNINLPLFNLCGDDDLSDGIEVEKVKHMQGGQEVTMINFNIERVARKTPGGVLGDAMREVYPGTWCGRIEFTAQPDWNCLNTVDFKIWENDGSGSRIITRNSLHKTLCTTAERESYYPMFGQQVFDTDLNKMLICVDPENRKWVDANGKTI